MDSLTFLERTSRSRRPISIVPVPFSGGSDGEGMDMTPDTLLEAGMHRVFTEQGWHTSVLPAIEVRTHAPEDTSRPVNDPAFVAMTEETFQTVQSEIQNGQRVLVLGGDHSVALGSISAALSQYPDLGVIWIDAHGDINTQSSSPSGNVHGMVNAFLIHEDTEHPFAHYPTLSAEHLFFLGLKDLDQPEIDLIRRKNISYVTMIDLLIHGHQKMFDQLSLFLNRHKQIWVSYDIDSVHADAAPAASMSTLGGFRHREITTLCRFIGQKSEVVGVDFVEMVPQKDVDGLTANLAIETITSLFGGTHDWYTSYIKHYAKK